MAKENVAPQIRQLSFKKASENQVRPFKLGILRLLKQMDQHSVLQCERAGPLILPPWHASRYDCPTCPQFHTYQH